MPSHAMGDEGLWAFLSASPPHIAKLSTTRKDGRPHWAAIVGSRYLDEDQTEAYGAPNGVRGELLVSLRPAMITSAADSAL